MKVTKKELISLIESIVKEKLNEGNKKQVKLPSDFKLKSLSGRTGYIEKEEGNKSWINFDDNSNDESMWIPVKTEDISKYIGEAIIKEEAIEMSPADVWNDLLKMYNNDKQETAKAMLDILTGGMWAAWDQDKIDKFVKKVLQTYDKTGENPMNTDNDKTEDVIEEGYTGSQLWNNMLSLENYDYTKAAEAILDIITGGKWQVWDKEKAKKAINTIINKYTKKK